MFSLPRFLAGVLGSGDVIFWRSAMLRWRKIRAGRSLTWGVHVTSAGGPVVVHWSIVLRSLFLLPQGLFTCLQMLLAVPEFFKLVWFSKSTWGMRSASTKGPVIFTLLLLLQGLFVLLQVFFALSEFFKIVLCVAIVTMLIAITVTFLDIFTVISRLSTT